MSPFIYTPDWCNIRHKDVTPPNDSCSKRGSLRVIQSAIGMATEISAMATLNYDGIANTLDSIYIAAPIGSGLVTQITCLMRISTLMER